MRRLAAASMTFDEAKGAASGGGKDLELGFFKATEMLFDPSPSRSFNSRSEAAFQDHDIMPLMVAENYVSYNDRENETASLERRAAAADFISLGDLLAKKVRAQQKWFLLPSQVAMGCVAPAIVLRGTRRESMSGEFSFRFPGWLGKNSTANKQRRLLQDLAHHARGSGASTADTTAVRISYVPVLAWLLTMPLNKQQKEGIPAVLSLMDAYSLDKDNFDAVQGLVSYKGGRDLMAQVETATKSALTRAINKAVEARAVHSSACADVAPVRKGKGGKKGKAEKKPKKKKRGVEEDGMPIDEAEEDSDDDDSGSDDDDGGGGNGSPPASPTAAKMPKMSAKRLAAMGFVSTEGEKAVAPSKAAKGAAGKGKAPAGPPAGAKGQGPTAKKVAAAAAAKGKK